MLHNVYGSIISQIQIHLHIIYNFCVCARVHVCDSCTETPLSSTAHLENMADIIKVLKNGGAHLDFRAKDGMTALHRAARTNNKYTLMVWKGRGCVKNSVYCKIKSIIIIYFLIKSLLFFFFNSTFFLKAF